MSPKTTEQSMRARRLYQAARKLCVRFDFRVGVHDAAKGCSPAEILADFDRECEQLKHQYADLFASKVAWPNRRLITGMLNDVRASVTASVVTTAIDSKEYE